ncbi:MAG: hypothetical protein WD066_12900 [Planctomycetaceae bacterium]
MNREHAMTAEKRCSRRNLLRVLGAGGAAALLAGCSQVVLIGLLLGGPPSIAPKFDVATNRSMTDKDVTVAVVCYVPPERKFEFPGIDHELAKHVCHRLKDHNVQVIRPELVRSWLDEHPNWDRPEEIGKAFDTSYVIYLDVLDFSLYEYGRSDLYRGRSEVTIRVTAVNPRNKDEWEEVYTDSLISQWPTEIPRHTQDITYERFKLGYLARLSEEIGRYFYEHFNGDDIADAT